VSSETTDYFSHCCLEDEIVWVTSCVLVGYDLKLPNRKRQIQMLLEEKTTESFGVIRERIKLLVNQLGGFFRKRYPCDL